MSEITVYVDGSYNDALKKYAFGCVFLTPEGVRCACGSGNNPDSLKSRNVTGEMLGAMYAVQCARKSGYDTIHIYYDYRGIEDWVTGAWKTKNDLTKKYAAAMRGWGQEITLHFHKVAAHTNVTYNELADEMAKKGLETEGIPAIMPVSEIEIHDA